mmetsp:Transcript_82646/g.229319  ORF Transcript_82646/g.229319 Transcript_82646/m.229319 type:complete len:232 (+) Transcript_82646:1601-2296(+)
MGSGSCILWEPDQSMTWVGETDGIWSTLGTLASLSGSEGLVGESGRAGPSGLVGRLSPLPKPPRVPTPAPPGVELHEGGSWCGTSSFLGLRRLEGKCRRWRRFEAEASPTPSASLSMSSSPRCLLSAGSDSWRFMVGLRLHWAISILCTASSSRPRRSATALKASWKRGKSIRRLATLMALRKMRSASPSVKPSSLRPQSLQSWMKPRPSISLCPGLQYVWYTSPKLHITL